MIRRLLAIISALSAALFLALLFVWVLRVHISSEVAGSQWGSTLIVFHYEFRPIPDLMIGVRPVFFFVVPFVVPMALLLLLPALWAVLQFLRRRRRDRQRGFPLDSRDSAAAS